MPLLWGHPNLKVNHSINLQYVPNEEFELAANSLGAHIETHGKLILRTLKLHHSELTR